MYRFRLDIRVFIEIVFSTYLIKNDPLNVPHKICVAIQHGPEDLGGHDEAGGLWVESHVARDQAHVELVSEVSVLLVADRLG